MTMRYVRHAVWVAVIVMLFVLPIVLWSCGGGGGSGSSSNSSSGGNGGGGGSVVDNSKAIGTFTYVHIDASVGLSVDRGILTFDGAGNGTLASLLSTASRTFNYSVATPGNSISIDGIGIGTIDKSGNFITVALASAEILMYGVKQSSAFFDTMATYIGGEFTYNQPPSSSVTLFSMTTATPVAGNLMFENLVSNDTWTIDYVIASDGTFTFHPSAADTFGAVSVDKNIMIYCDSDETIASKKKSAAIALKMPGSGMINSSLTGTFQGYEIYDRNIGGAFPSIGIARYTLTFDGSGSGTYALDEDSYNRTGSGSFNYAVNDNGRFMIYSVGSDTVYGIVLQDGSLISYVDPSSVDGFISSGVAIKQ